MAEFTRRTKQYKPFGRVEGAVNRPRHVGLAAVQEEYVVLEAY